MVSQRVSLQVLFAPELRLASEEYQLLGLLHFQKAPLGAVCPSLHNFLETVVNSIKRVEQLLG